MSTVIGLIINLTGIAAFSWWFYTRQDVQVRKFYWPALTLKLFAGTAVGCLYVFHYKTGDTLSYWHDGNLVAKSLLDAPIDTIRFFWNEEAATNVAGLFHDKPRSIFFVKIAGVLSFLSYGNYWIMAAILSLLSFLGAWYLFLKIIHFVPNSRIAAAIAILFFPSIVFWSSGLIKESLGLGAMLFLAGVILTVLAHQRVRPWEWVTAAISGWIAWQLKYYWVGIFIPVAAATIITDQWTLRRPGLIRFEIGIWTGLFIVIILVATGAHPNFYPGRILEVIVENNMEFMRLSDPGNAVHYHDLRPTLPSILSNAPRAFLAGLFRPYVWEAHNTLSLLAGVENLILLVLSVTSLRNLPAFFQSRWRLTAFALLVFVALLAVFLALSTPNLGTLSRYKIGFLPFLVFLIAYNNPLINRLR